MDNTPTPEVEDAARQDIDTLEQLRPFADLPGQKDVEAAHEEPLQPGDPEVPLERLPGEGARGAPRVTGEPGERIEFD